LYERRNKLGGNDSSLDRWNDICKPAFDRTRNQFEEVFTKFEDVQTKLESNRDFLERKIELNRESLVMLREKLNNGVNDKINNLERMMNRLYWVVIGASGSIIITSVGFLITYIFRTF
jgi:hypothetical protein